MVDRNSQIQQIQMNKNIRERREAKIMLVALIVVFFGTIGLIMARGDGSLRDVPSGGVRQFAHLHIPTDVTHLLVLCPNAAEILHALNAGHLLTDGSTPPCAIVIAAGMEAPAQWPDAPVITLPEAPTLNTIRSNIRLLATLAGDYLTGHKLAFDILEIETTLFHLAQEIQPPRTLYLTPRTPLTNELLFILNATQSPTPQQADLLITLSPQALRPTQNITATLIELAQKIHPGYF